MPDVRALLSLARRAVLYELSLYRSLLRWVARRPSVGGPQEQPVGYAQTATPVIWLWIFGSAVEIPVAHLLLPWESVRGVVLVLGVWGLLWMLGLLASLRAYPHLVSDAHLRVRHGSRIDLEVPWADVTGVRVRRCDLPSSIRVLQRDPADEDRLHVAVGGETNVSIDLRRPLTARTPGGDVVFHGLSLLVDDPRQFVADARRRMTRADAPAAGTSSA